MTFPWLRKESCSGHKVYTTVYVLGTLSWENQLRGTFRFCSCRWLTEKTMTTRMKTDCWCLITRIDFNSLNDLNHPLEMKKTEIVAYDAWIESNDICVKEHAIDADTTVMNSNKGTTIHSIDTGNVQLIEMLTDRIENVLGDIRTLLGYYKGVSNHVTLWSQLT